MRLCEFWIISFIVTMFAIAYHVDKHVRIKFLAKSRGDLSTFHHCFRIVAIDGPRRRAPAKACALLRLTELEQRAMGDVGSCWGVGGAIAVAEEQRGRAAVGNGAGGSGAGMAAVAGEEEGRGNEKWSVEGCRADAGGVKAVPRRGVACVDRLAATRGRFPRHAARGV